MKDLKQRVAKEGIILPGKIVKVDSFINHQIDVQLLNEMGVKFKERFNNIKVDKILTIEASGIAIIVSVFGAMNGYLLTGEREPLVMGERNQLPYATKFATVHKTFGTPANALIFECVLAVIYIFSGSFNTLTDLLVFVLWIFFVAGVYGVFILRKRIPASQRPYNVPFFLITPIIGILGGTYILYSTIISSPLNSIVGIVITLIGLPVYFYLKKRSVNGNNN